MLIISGISYLNLQVFVCGKANVLLWSMEAETHLDPECMFRGANLDLPTTLSLLLSQSEQHLRS